MTFDSDSTDLHLVADSPPVLSDHLYAARAFAVASRAPRTREAYRAEWKRFESYCGERGLSPLPAGPTTLAAYVGYLGSQYSVSTVGKSISAIALAHRTAGHVSPTEHAIVREIIGGVRRTKGVAPDSQKKPILLEHLSPIVSALAGDDVRLVRDRALLTFGWCSALRRSELSALKVNDLTFDDRGIRARVRRSKTDQYGTGDVIGVPRLHDVRICPVRHLRAWLDALGGVDGDTPVFRGILGKAAVQETPLSGRGFARVVQRSVERIGLNPAEFGAHSLRAGFITSCASRGVSEVAIARVSRHRSLEVLSGYVRLASVFDAHPVSAMGL